MLFLQRAMSRANKLLRGIMNQDQEILEQLVIPKHYGQPTEKAKPREIANYTAIYQETKETLGRIPSVQERVAWLHHTIDRLVAFDNQEYPNRDIQCKRGCAHCCYILAVVTDDEAELLAQRLREKPDAEVYRRIQAQAKEPHQHEYTEKVPIEMRKCAFLSNDECAVYEMRPAVCRKYLVVTPPENCDTILNNGAPVASCRMMLPSMVYAAALECGGGPMGKMLVQKLGLPEN